MFTVLHHTPISWLAPSILTSDVADKEREGRGWRKKKHVLECGGLSQNLMIHLEYCDFLWHISWQTIFHYQNSRKCKYKDKDEANFYQLSRRKWFTVYLYFFFHNVTSFIFALWWFCLYSVNNDWEWLRNSTWSGVLGNKNWISTKMTSFFTKLMKMSIYFYQIKDIHFLICDLHKTVLLIIIMLMMINSAQRYNSR